MLTSEMICIERGGNMYFGYVICVLCTVLVLPGYVANPTMGPMVMSNSTDHNMTNHNMTDHSMTNHNMTDHNMTDHNMTDHNMTDHSMTDHNMTHSHEGQGHDSMDHSTHDSPGHYSYFHHTDYTVILFKGWTTDSGLELLGSCVAVFLVAFFYEGLKVLRVHLRSKFPTGKSKRNKRISCAHICQSLLHMVQMIYSYLLMLVFMTFNIGLCTSVSLGMALGYFIFRADYPDIDDQNEHCQ